MMKYGFLYFQLSYVNWSSLPQLKSVSVLSEPVLVKSVESLFNVTSSEDGLKSAPNNNKIIMCLSCLFMLSFLKSSRPWGPESL